MKRYKVGKGFLIAGLVCAIIGLLFNALGLLVTAGFESYFLNILKESSYDTKITLESIMQIAEKSDELLNELASMGDSLDFRALSDSLLFVMYMSFYLVRVFLLVIVIFDIVGLVLISIATVKSSKAKSHKEMVTPSVCAIVGGVFGTLFPIVSGILFLTLKDKDFSSEE